jgi:hypothetical protein
MLKQLNFVSELDKAKDDKKARIVILIFLGITLIPSVIFWGVSKWRMNPPEFENPLGKIDVSKVNLVEKNIYSMTPKIDRWAEENINNLPGEWSIKINFLEEDFSWQRYSTRSMPGASLMKLPVVAAFYHQVEEGEYDLDEELSGKAMRELAEIALSQSDNQAWQMLENEIGEAKINSLMFEWGMNDTSIEDNTTTAEDINLFFTELYQGKILSTKYKEMMLTALTDTIYETEIPAGVPEGIRVAHKVGYLDDVVSDAGIIYFPDNPYVLVIMSDQTNFQEAKNKFPEIVNKLYWIIADSI